jgi:hypothetical protein
MHGEIKGLTGFSKWLAKWMIGSFIKACAKDLDAVKKRLESQRSLIT